MTNYKRKELIFNATISARDFTLENVFCRIYLPIKVTDDIELRFYPNKEQSEILSKPDTRLSIFSISGEIRNSPDEIQQTISAKKVVSRGLSTDSRGYNVSETKFRGNALDLRITHHVNHLGTAQIFEGNFWISPNHLLESSFIFNRSRLGEISFESPHNFKFRVDENIELTFEDVYQNTKNEQDDEVHFFETIASFLVEGKKSEEIDFNELLAKFKDILLLASFAARQSCHCFGWSTYDTKVDITQYLRDKSKPDDLVLKRKFYFRDAIIDIADFEEFLPIAFENFVKFSEIDVLRRIINFTIPNSRKTIEGEFVTLYAALEMLVSHYRKGNDLEFILKSKYFKKVRSSLKAEIEKLEIEDGQKKMMQDKLSELNRVPFVTAFDEFCKTYSVDLQDLWSVTDNTNGITLAQVRNRLVHGEHFNNEDNFALTYAKDHLQWTVERMILGVLNFPVTKSQIHSSRLGNWYSYTKWNDYQKVLTK